MPRWDPDGLERLRAAAFDLFEEQGFERTTVAEIARRAGLTQRTFFNHFADKREVLFGLSGAFQDHVVRAVADPSGTMPALDAVVAALQGAADAMFEGHRVAVTRRHRIVGANPELRERELGKQAVLSAAIADALRGRGLDAEAASVIAGAAMLVQEVAVRRWVRATDDRPLRDELSDALDDLRSTLGRAADRGHAVGGA